MTRENSARGVISEFDFLLNFLVFSVTQIGINGFLSVGIVLYCISSVILLIGISEVIMQGKRTS